jgi:hypothetical protein
VKARTPLGYPDIPLLVTAPLQRLTREPFVCFLKDTTQSSSHGHAVYGHDPCSVTSLYKAIDMFQRVYLVRVSGVTEGQV